MRVLVCGGRTFGDIASITRDDPLWKERKLQYTFGMGQLNRLSMNWPKTPKDEFGNCLPTVTIISGGATGGDSIGIDWAVVNWCRFEEYKPDWNKHGKAAGPIRNQQMLDEGKPDLVVAFPGGRGTADMIRRAEASGVPVIGMGGAYQ